MFKFMTGLTIGLLLIAGCAARTADAADIICAGTISSISGEMVTVKTANDQEQQMVVVPATRITLDGKPARSEDLKVGQRVQCICK
jgi:hypothetical protein